MLSTIAQLLSTAYAVLFDTLNVLEPDVFQQEVCQFHNSLENSI